MLGSYRRSLSGAGNDDIDDLSVMRKNKGSLIVQDIEEAFISILRQNAVDNGLADHVLPINGITAFLYHIR